LHSAHMDSGCFRFYQSGNSRYSITWHRTLRILPILFFAVSK
jgi:hypothetical protein